MEFSKFLIHMNVIVATQCVQVRFQNQIKQLSHMTTSEYLGNDRLVRCNDLTTLIRIETLSESRQRNRLQRK